jgi:2-oxoisovalerate dehydrogenase E1 component
MGEDIKMVKAKKSQGEKIDLALALKWFRLSSMARQLDDKAALYIRRGMGWSYHARCSGHEGIQIALGLAFRAGKDYLFPYYRDTATALAAGLTPYELVLNGLSKAKDVASGGRHMSNHFAKPEINIQNVSSCTGNHTLHAVGLGRAVKYYGSDAVVFSSQGESSVSEGYCYEAINGASKEKVPVIFVVQNNGYGISVPTCEQTANVVVSDNFIGFKNLGIFNCDGTDVFDATHKMDLALKYVKDKKGPAMVHAQCVRIGAHSNSDAQDLYRSEEELNLAKSQDPLEKLRLRLLAHTSEDELKKIEMEVTQLLEESCERAEKCESPAGESVTQFVFAKAFVPPKVEAEYVPVDPNPEEKLREAITRTLIEEFEHNPHTFLWGQDCASKKKGGVFNLTKGMLDKFGPGRVSNAPIAEDFIVGTANGMSRFRKDLRVVIEAAQFADYVWPAMEQIVEMGHDYWRSNGQFSPNVVLRLPSGGYINGGLYHSQNVEAIMSHLPGIRVVYPSFADDAAGLLRTAIRSEGPTFFLEPKYLYNRPEAKAPQYGNDFAIDFGKSRVRRPGRDASVITYGNTTHLALAVAEDLAGVGIEIEVVDLRSIRPLDMDGIGETVRRTNRALVLHEDHMFNGIGSEVAAIIAEQHFSHLDAPVMRLAAKDIPIGFAKTLETAILPQAWELKEMLERLVGY